MNFFNLKNLAITNLCVFQCVVETSSSSIKPREFHSLSYRISGKTEISQDGKSMISKQGDVTYVPKRKEYSHIVNTPSEIIVVHFDLSDNIDTDISVLTPVNVNEIEKLFLSLIKCWEENPLSGNINCMMLMYRILSKLCTQQVQPDINKNHRLLGKAIEYMRLNYTNVDLSIAYLAQLSGISEAYFRRLFEQVYKVSPIKYIKFLRIDCAKRLLETGFYSINEVALRSGFASASYFSTEFRNESGFTPREYVNLTKT